MEDLFEVVFLETTLFYYYKLPAIHTLAKNIDITEKPNEEETIKYK